jgi:hypothetical protein
LVFTICAKGNVVSLLQHVLYIYVCTFHNICALLNTAVFCSSPLSTFPHMLLRCGLSDSEVIPAASIITGITFAFTFQMS